MRKKIFTDAFLLGISILLICAGLFFALQYKQTMDETYDALKGEAVYAAAGLEIGGWNYLEEIKSADCVTWIAADGTVLYDSSSPELNNQKDCPEVRDALTDGEGYGVRSSDSTGASTMYYACRCEDGTVLRLSRPLSVVRDALIAVSPILWVILLVLLISGVMAFRLADRILRPVNGLNIDDPDPSKTYPELSPLVERLREQKEAIQTEVGMRENLRKEFSANVSHELKTPLTSISVFAELMRDGNVPEDKVREFSGDIYRESQRMITLVDDIMRLSKLDEEKGFPEAELIDLFALAKDILSRLKSQADQRDISLSLSGEHVEINGVTPVIDEMIYNLVDNAIKYNRDGGSVRVRTGRKEGRPYLSVMDTGIGIPKEAQERVFERFYRVDKSHSKKIGGTGLGLSIVKHGAHLHGAEIELQSEPGEGTAITILF